jgi:DNA-binding CsgD family transcriptional regulator
MAQKKRPERDSRRWTEEEDDLLMELIGTSNYNSIATKLKRSPQAVEKRLQDLGTSDKYLLTGMMSARELALHLNRDIGYVLKLIREHGLPAKTNNMNFKDKKQITYYFIQPEKFWTWAEKNRDKLNFSLIEEGAILPEPDWLEAQRRIDYYKPVNRKYWTEEQEKKVVELIKAGYSRKQVADVFKRGVDSISWVIKKHGIGNPRRAWTTEEKKTIVELVRSGKAPQEIADDYGVTRTVIYNIYQKNKDKL